MAAFVQRDPTMRSKTAIYEIVSILLVVASLNPCANAFAPPSNHQQPPPTSHCHRHIALFAEAGVGAPFNLKTNLIASIVRLRNLQEQDGDFSVDFGVKGGELNETSRAPQRVDYYSISDNVGQAADQVLDICDQLSQVSPIDEPTKYLGDKENGDISPLNGAWKLLFTTAADATFSKNTTRGNAKAQNVVDASKGRITNIIDFSSKNGTEPALKQLNVVIKATAASKTRVELQFRYAKAVLTKFFFLPLFGRTLPLYIPVPGPFVTRIIVFLSRIFRFGRGGAKKVPKAYFDVMYLDKDLRIHKTGEDNIFVQAKDTWGAAEPLLERT